MSEQADNTFKAILKECRANKRLAQRQLYELYYGYGMSIALRYLHNQDDALEVLNDCFLKVFKNLNKYDSDKPFKPWFRRVLINTALNHIKKYEKLKLEETMEEKHNIMSAESILSNINYQELLAMVQQLSPSYKTVFNLYVIDGFKHEEIADMLQISAGTSKSNLFKAKSKLKEMILQTLNL